MLNQWNCPLLVRKMEVLPYSRLWLVHFGSWNMLSCIPTLSIIVMTSFPHTCCCRRIFAGALGPEVLPNKKYVYSCTSNFRHNYNVPIKSYFSNIQCCWIHFLSQRSIVISKYSNTVLLWNNNGKNFWLQNPMLWVIIPKKHQKLCEIFPKYAKTCHIYNETKQAKHWNASWLKPNPFLGNFCDAGPV